MSKYRVLGFKPQLRLEWRGQDGQHETEQLDHSASLGDSVALGSLQAYDDRIFGLISVPMDVLPVILQILIADRFTSTTAW